MNNRERLERACAGEATDRPPAALWRHFPGDDQRAADLATSIVEFQRTYNWDFTVIMPPKSFCTTDYGLQDEWRGAPNGERTVSKHPIVRSLDWTTLRVLDPMRGGLGRMAECARMVVETLNDETPVLHAIFSPLAQARHLCGDAALRRFLRLDSGRLHTGLNVLTENTLRFIETLKRLSVAGIYYIVEHADYEMLSEEEYATFGFAYDCKIMESLPTRWWFNLLRFDGALPMLKFASRFPAHALSWQDRDGEPDLVQGKTLFAGAVCGGLSPCAHLAEGTPITVREAVSDALQKTAGRRLILSSGSPLHMTTPLSNIRAFRQAVERP